MASMLNMSYSAFQCDKLTYFEGLQWQGGWGRQMSWRGRRRREHNCRCSMNAGRGGGRMSSIPKSFLQTWSKSNAFCACMWKESWIFTASDCFYSWDVTTDKVYNEIYSDSILFPKACRPSFWNRMVSLARDKLFLFITFTMIINFVLFKFPWPQNRNVSFIWLWLYEEC